MLDHPGIQVNVPAVSAASHGAVLLPPGAERVPDQGEDVDHGTSGLDFWIGTTNTPGGTREPHEEPTCTG